MDRHIDFLKQFCRICDEDRINLSASSIKTVKGNAKHIKKIYDIDVSGEDPTKYSKYSKLYLILLVNSTKLN